MEPMDPYSHVKPIPVFLTVSNFYIVQTKARGTRESGGLV